MGDRAGRSPARKKPPTAICSQPALDPCCLRAPFRRCGLVWTNGDGGRGSVPSFVGALSGGCDGDRSPCEELARRNVNGERSPILGHGGATDLEILRLFCRTTNFLASAGQCRGNDQAEDYPAQFADEH